MGRVGLAFKTFFRVLRDRGFADGVRRLVEQGPAALPEAPTVPTTKPTPVTPPKPEPPAARRSEALTLLAVLQREARFVDFVKESIAGYDDAQVGAAVRDVHRDCGAVLERLFALKPVLDQPEGSKVDVPAGFDAGRFRLVGNVTGQAPYRGTLQHAGWEATRVQVPEWGGSDNAARVVAPAEVEL